MNVLKRAYAQFYWQTWSNVNPALDIAHHNDIMQSIREKDLEKTQNYLKEDLADFLWVRNETECMGTKNPNTLCFFFARWRPFSGTLQCS